MVSRGPSGVGACPSTLFSTRLPNTNDARRLRIPSSVTSTFSLLCGTLERRSASSPTTRTTGSRRRQSSGMPSDCPYLLHVLVPISAAATPRTRAASTQTRMKTLLNSTTCWPVCSRNGRRPLKGERCGMQLSRLNRPRYVAFRILFRHFLLTIRFS